MVQHVTDGRQDTQEGTSLPAASTVEPRLVNIFYLPPTARQRLEPSSFVHATHTNTPTPRPTNKGIIMFEMESSGAAAHPSAEAGEYGIVIMPHSVSEEVSTKWDEIRRWLLDSSPGGGASFVGHVPIMRPYRRQGTVERMEEALWTLLSKLCEQFHLQYYIKQCRLGENDVQRTDIIDTLETVRWEPFVSLSSSGDEGTLDEDTRQALIDQAGEAPLEEGDLLRLGSTERCFPTLRLYLLAAYIRKIVARVAVYRDEGDPLFDLEWKADNVLDQVMIDHLRDLKWETEAQAYLSSRKPPAGCKPERSGGVPREERPKGSDGMITDTDFCCDTQEYDLCHSRVFLYLYTKHLLWGYRVGNEVGHSTRTRDEWRWVLRANQAERRWPGHQRQRMGMSLVGGVERPPAVEHI
ncbi:hypothetical protein EDB80DRAFT_822706 [Ilyonectria destructans]|nr:hypothetical protein EDB80DRAFT_822706 [Ilyonectria destructans]